MIKPSKVIIIGAGPAGLTAGYELLKRSSCEVIILEESNEIGGISRTVKYNGNRMDIGGHRFFSKNENVMNWWKEILPLQGKPSKDDLILSRKKDLYVDGPDPQDTDRVMLLRERVSRIYYDRKFYDYPISPKLETFLNMGLPKTMKAGYSYIYSSMFKREENSLEDFLINRFGQALYSMFFENYTEKVWGVHPSQISAEWGAQRIKGLSLSKVLLDIIKKPFRKSDLFQKEVETSLIEQFLYPKYGPGQLWETVAKEIEDMGGIILKKSKVTNINIEHKVVKSVEYEDEKGQHSIDGDMFISSMPIKDLVSGIKGVEVPTSVSHIAKELPYRDFITVGLLLNKLNLKNQTKIKTVGNIVPDCWIYIQESDVQVGRLQIFNNWSPYMVRDFETTVWVGMEYFCNEGDRMWNMSDEEFINMASKELVKLGIIDDCDMLDSIRVRVKKAYPAYFGSYEFFNQIKDYLNGFNNLYCVGRNGQHRYNNMDHSMLTAFEAVSNIFNGRTDKANVWSVNTEEEYHETQNEYSSDLKVSSKAI